VVDSGRVVMSNLARQSLYTSNDRKAPKATAILEHLRERCLSVVSFHILSFESVL
jgi:ubiquitin-like modifier-activating enzyme ATG7